MNAEDFEEYKQSAIKLLQSQGELTPGEIEIVCLQMEQAYRELQANKSYEILFNMLTYTSLIYFLYLNFH